MKALKKKCFYSLRESHNTALKSLSQLGEKGLIKLREIAFNNNIPMKTRWKSFMVLAELQGKKNASADVEQALSSDVLVYEECRSYGIPIRQSTSDQ